MKTEDYFKELKIKPTTFLIIILITIMAFGIVLPFTLVMLFPNVFTGFLFIAVYLLSSFFIIIVVMLPLILRSRRKSNVERNMPLFITQMAALSTSDMSFDKVFYMLSQRTDYGELAEDAKKIYRLMKHYNVGASEACRFVSVRAVSPMEMNFFNRLSHSLDVGEKLDRFMKNEHEVIMDEYVLKSESSIKDLDFIKEMYTGIVTALIFTTVFICIAPVLGVGDVSILLIGIVLTFAAMEAFFIYFIVSKMPKENIWYGWREKKKTGYTTDKDRLLVTAIIISLVGVAAMAMLLIPLGLPLLFTASTIFLPVLVPGILIMREEGAIEKRDNIYGAFIRSLGRSSEVSGTTMAEAMKKLSLHSFGPLTAQIRNLSKRLNMHIDATDSWRHFASETGSNLIYKFGEMYTRCVQNGSKAEATSIFISNNMFKIMTIRKKKQMLSSSFVGIVYGVMISLAFTLYITIGIVQYMANTMSGIAALTSDTGTYLTTLFSATVNIGSLQTMAFAVIFIHAFFSSMMLPLLHGGHIMSFVTHFIALLWVASVAMIASQMMLSGLGIN